MKTHRPITRDWLKSIGAEIPFPTLCVFSNDTSRVGVEKVGNSWLVWIEQKTGWVNCGNGISRSGLLQILRMLKIKVQP